MLDRLLEAAAAWAEADQVIGGNLSLDLCNTVSGRHRDERRERLSGPLELAGWALAAGALPRASAPALEPLVSEQEVPETGEASATLKRLRVLRAALYGALTAELDGRLADPPDLESIAGAVAEARRALRLTQSQAGFLWVLPEKASGWQELEWRIALAIPEVLGPERPAPLRQCGRCSWLFLDRSRGRQRSWCSSRRCGNRARVERHYRRHGTAPD
ncbi:CGNR zinc finger domain-containing protein [Algihabitans albus]|uniref:CGNR zinc finger domain-containing protein n=1 Tax=Algihabitans albus TaxID=2164067 RepID=UPI000E5DA10E|nr:ABATE domain-containing protein [Algihabitans albus]